MLLRFGKRDSRLRIDRFSIKMVRSWITWSHRSTKSDLFYKASKKILHGERTAIQLPHIILSQQSSRLLCALGFSDFSSYSGMILERRRAHVQQASSIFVHQFKYNEQIMRFLTDTSVLVVQMTRCA